MAASSPTAQRRLFTSIEINLLLWLAVIFLPRDLRVLGLSLPVIGFILAALIQHWAYYSLVKSSSR